MTYGTEDLEALFLVIENFCGDWYGQDGYVVREGSGAGRGSWRGWGRFLLAGEKLRVNSQESTRNSSGHRWSHGKLVAEKCRRAKRLHLGLVLHILTTTPGQDDSRKQNEEAQVSREPASTASHPRIKTFARLAHRRHLPGSNS